VVLYVATIVVGLKYMWLAPLVRLLVFPSSVLLRVAYLVYVLSVQPYAALYHSFSVGIR